MRKPLNAPAVAVAGIPGSANPVALSAFQIGAKRYLAVASAIDKQIHFIDVTSAGTLVTSVGVAHPPVYLGAADLTLLHWRPSEDQLSQPDHGRAIRVGRLEIRCVVTPGHTAGGICYRVEMPWGPVSFVGDTLFAGSIGRSNPAQLYQTHLASVKTHVLSMPSDCWLLPGHGPGTTVQEELEHNPFYTTH